MTATDDLAELKRLSVRIGTDLALVQGAGGNTSVKLDDVLWVKASGTWLADAERTPIFVPIDLPAARQTFAAGQEKVGVMEGRDAPAGLRPSIETSLHALLPQRVVVHVHSVNTIAWCVQPGGRDAVAERLRDLNWTWLPYCRPGLPLARAVGDATAGGRAPDVVLLANHGLVVAGESCAAADALLNVVEERLELPESRAPDGERAALAALAEGSPYEPAESTLWHGLGTDPDRLRVASGGTLYPDHVVFLGDAVRVLGASETPAGLAVAAEAEDRAPPALLLVPGKGLLVRQGLSQGALDLVECLARVAARLPRGAPVTYVPEEEVRLLLGWEAEKYRKGLNRPS